MPNTYTSFFFLTQAIFKLNGSNYSNNWIFVVACWGLLPSASETILAYPPWFAWSVSISRQYMVWATISKINSAVVDERYVKQICQTVLIQCTCGACWGRRRNQLSTYTITQYTRQSQHNSIVRFYVIGWFACNIHESLTIIRFFIFVYNFFGYIIYYIYVILFLSTNGTFDSHLTDEKKSNKSKDYIWNYFFENLIDRVPIFWQYFSENWIDGVSTF